MNPQSTRGYLNNNPGNLDRGPQAWEGEIRDVEHCQNAIQKMELTQGRFCVFVDAQHGIRAMVKNLWAYRDRLGAKSIRDYINRWAPPNENNTIGYIQRVCDTVGVSPDDPVDISQRVVIHALVEGIISVECAGNPYEGTDTVDQGLTLAGVA